MQLFFAPLACSLVVRVVANEAKIPLEYTQVEVFAKALTESGKSYYEDAPLGMVPVLRLDDGTQLTEVLAIGTYLADLYPESTLAPRADSIERYQMLSWLGFLSTELHKKVIWVIANAGIPPEAKAHAKTMAPAILDHLERNLEGRTFLVGSSFTVADAYLAWALTLCRIVGLELGERRALRDYGKRLRERPSVREAIDTEMPLALAATARQRHLLEDSAFVKR